ncbi:MAG: hypothetical protein E6J29_03515 [Chloroflexi bacterium]|nr:MAG: hypothetical protein E6J29_03515 [Chloroflexota bacterium]TMD54049.1 MAG: hypothetical protein E6I85_06910 [Chloroflexota bacterium]
MKVQFFLLGAVVALTLGALSSASLAPVASHSKAATARSAAAPSPETAKTTSATPEAADAAAAPDASASPSAHPCNHGFYVSQVAHEHKGGKFTSSVAQSDLGKNGDCSKPVPTPTA